MTNQTYLRNLRTPTAKDPLRILVSACMTGLAVGWDGTNNGEFPTVLKLMRSPLVRLVRFCPEDYSFGTPRPMSDLHGGNGYDVLDGRARVLTEQGEDWTAGMIRASEKMLELARKERVELAVLMDISAACGSQVIYLGNRFAENKVYQKGPGLCAAQLKRNGIEVISQRDFASLEILYGKLDPTHQPNPEAIDHHQQPWYREYFGVADVQE